MSSQFLLIIVKILGENLNKLRLVHFELVFVFLRLLLVLFALLFFVLIHLLQFVSVRLCPF